MRFEKRLRRLESETTTDPVILRFADGSTRTISGDQLLALCPFIDKPSEATPLQQKHLNWIANCTGAIETGGGEMIPFIRCVLMTGPDGNPLPPFNEDKQFTAETGR